MNSKTALWSAARPHVGRGGSYTICFPFVSSRAAGSVLLEAQRRAWSDSRPLQTQRPSSPERSFPDSGAHAAHPVTPRPVPAGSKESLFSCTLTASEEAMGELEEVILYAFQQCVYYISKVRWVLLAL